MEELKKKSKLDKESPDFQRKMIAFLKDKEKAMEKMKNSVTSMMAFRLLFVFVGFFLLSLIIVCCLKGVVSLSLRQGRSGRGNPYWGRKREWESGRKSSFSHIRSAFYFTG